MYAEQQLGNWMFAQAKFNERCGLHQVVINGEGQIDFRVYIEAF